MPLSDHEQRMLDQIESALYAEDPKFASSVRGGGFRAPTARRRLQGAALFIIGLGMLVSGVAFKETMIGSFPILSVFGFVVCSVVWCMPSPVLGCPAGWIVADRLLGLRASVVPRGPGAHSPAVWKIGSGAASTSKPNATSGSGAAIGGPAFCLGVIVWESQSREAPAGSSPAVGDIESGLSPSCAPLGPTCHPFARRHAVF